jgi:proton-coupled amino acid transporter
VHAAQIEETGLHGSMEKVDGFPFFLGVAIYCYEGAGMVIALETSVPKEHRKEFPRILKIAITIITMLYMFFGASGYISYGSETEKIITLNMPPGRFPAIVKACLSFSLFFTYPVMMFPVSALLDKLLGTYVSVCMPPFQSPDCLCARA